MKLTVIKAAWPFLAIPVVIWAYVAGREGISAILVGAVLMSMFVPDLVRGTTQEKSGPYKSNSGKWLFSSVHTLSGPAARLSAARYVLVGLLLVGGGSVETARPGRVRELFTEGIGGAWTLILVGILLALTALVGVAPGRPADESAPTHGLSRAVRRILSGGLLAIAVVCVFAGWYEVVKPGSIADWIRQVNPLAAS